MGATDRFNIALAPVPASELPLTPTPDTRPHAPTPNELADLFRPNARQPARVEPTRERDRRIAALTRSCLRAKARTIAAQRAARLLTRVAKTDPIYEGSAREARATALALVRHRDAMQQQLTILVGAEGDTL